MSLTVLAPFTARDGENLALYEWPLDSWHGGIRRSTPPRGVVLIVHGLGEHACRYEHVADRLLDWGFAVRAYDQRGHGQSGGARGALPHENALIDDLEEIIDDTRMRALRLQRSYLGKASVTAPLPLILLGHSLGGLVVSRFVSLKSRPVEGLVLSSPALDAWLGAWQKFLLGFTPSLFPNLCVGNGLDAQYLCRDKKVVQDYLADRLVHDRISPRLGRFIAEAGPATVDAAVRWRTPTLLMYAGADRLVNPAGSRAFAQGATASPAVQPGTVSAACFENCYHELFNEPDAASVFGTLKTWLNARF